MVDVIDCLLSPVNGRLSNVDDIMLAFLLLIMSGAFCPIVSRLSSEVVSGLELRPMF